MITNDHVSRALQLQTPKKWKVTPTRVYFAPNKKVGPVATYMREEEIDVAIIKVQEEIKEIPIANISFEDPRALPQISFGGFG